MCTFSRMYFHGWLRKNPYSQPAPRQTQTPDMAQIHRWYLRYLDRRHGNSRWFHHLARESFTLAQTSPLGDPFPVATTIISWWGIALGFPKPQCRRVSPSLTLSRHLYFLATPRLMMAPSSGTLTLWRHNCMASWRKMCRQGEAWQHLWILEFQVSLRYCSSQPVDVHLRSFCRTPNLGSDNGLVPSGDKPLPQPMLTQF